MDEATQGQLEALADAIAALESRSDTFEIAVEGLADRAATRADSTDAALDRTRERLDMLTEGMASLIDQANGFEVRLKETRLATSIGIEQVQRAEMRIKATVQRAQKKLADSGVEDAAVDAEAVQLRLIDAGRGEAEPVPAVPEAVAVGGTRLESIVEQLRALGLSQ